MSANSAAAGVTNVASAATNYAARNQQAGLDARLPDFKMSTCAYSGDRSAPIIRITLLSGSMKV